MERTRFIAIAATTIDGRIARESRGGSGWTSRADKKFLRHELNSCDAVLLGRTTYELARTRLLRRKRNCIVLTSRVKTAVQQSPRLLFLNPRNADVRNIASERGLRRIAVLGGAKTYAYCLSHNLLDELHLTIEPIVFGKGISLFGEAPIQKGRFILASVRRLNKNGTMVLRYKHKK